MLELQFQWQSEVQQMPEGQMQARLQWKAQAPSKKITFFSRG